MVQLPSAARLSGNSKPGLGGRCLHLLQHAAGLDRDRLVGGVERRGRGSGAPRQQDLRAAAVGHAAADQAGVAALRHDADAMRAAQRAHDGGDLVGVAGRTTASARPR